MNPFKLAIIGAGPSAFYVAARIFKHLPKSTAPNVRIHLFDRLWSPHGLVRYGVAPDHPEVKNCTHKFDEIAKDSRFRFFGNVNIGCANPPNALSLPLSSIFKNYSHVLFATGCTLPRLHSGLLPSEYCVPAISIVHWYTNHPRAPPPPPLDKISHLSIIGNGNVSLDVARILLSDVPTLSKYDVPKSVLDVLSASKVKHISIIGRRGPLDAAFTTKELREMMNLPNAYMVPLDSSLTTPPQDGRVLTRQQNRILQLLSKGSDNPPHTTSKSWSLEFFRSPIGLELPTSSSSSPRLSLAHTDVDPTSKNPRAIPTGVFSTLATDFVVTSLGFFAEPLQREFYDPSVGRLRNVSGRVVSEVGKTLRNVYASGWAATGAKGVLASTMMDAYSVADTIVADWKAGSDGRSADRLSGDAQSFEVNEHPETDSLPEEVEFGLWNEVVVGYKDWKTIDLEERHRGSLVGKERERFNWPEAAYFLKSNSPLDIAKEAKRR